MRSWEARLASGPAASAMSATTWFSRRPFPLRQIFQRRPEDGLQLQRIPAMIRLDDARFQRLVR